MAVERIKAARWLKRLGLVVSLFFLLAPAGVANGGTTIVSLTFDDGYSNQYAVRPMLASHGMHGTFYINSNKVETNGTFLSWSQLTDLSGDGNEIAGHTLDHADLTTVDSTEARRQVCDDRWVLMSRGFPVTSFAYPYGARNSSLFSTVEGCGYNSARRAWGLCSPAVQFCPVAETVPPEESVFAIRTQDSVTSTTTLADMQRIVLEAESSGGGWVPLVFHHICNACNTWSTSAATLDAFLSWLAPRSASGTVVKTVNEVIGGTLQAPPPPPADSTPPTSSIACNSSACSNGWYAGAVSVSLSATDSGS